MEDNDDWKFQHYYRTFEGTDINEQQKAYGQKKKTCSLDMSTEPIFFTFSGFLKNQRQSD